MKPFTRVALAVLLLSACGDDKTETPRDDAGNPSDAGDRDAGRPDGGIDASRGDSGLDLTPTTCVTDRAPEVPQLALSTVIDGVDRLIFAAQPPGSSDWYLLRQTGEIEVFSGGQRRPTPFLDVSDEIMGLASTGAEYGLLGLAFAPDYQTSGLFYVTLTPPRGDDEYHDKLIEYKRSASDPYRADPASARVLLDLPRSAQNHNGGHVSFGPDGMLYIGTGDGGGACNDDQPRAPQDKTNLYGKILRLDPKAPAPHAAAGNPFSGATGDARVLHYGLRNPYTFSHDFMNGDLYIADVGQDQAEELSFATADQAGLNYGWPAFEGSIASTCGGRSGSAPGAVPPILTANRRDSEDPFRDYTSIIAGFVYRGREPKLSSLRGVFLFGDYEGDRMGWLRQCEGKTSPVAVFRKKADPNATSEAGFRGSPSFSTLSAIVQDNAGELYVLANFSSLLKIVPAN
ncbi:MAG: PQQ-dependent sugar dehydrogenase [Polyangiales bacterium]